MGGGGQKSGVRTRTGGRVECKAARKANRSQGNCIAIAGWKEMQGKLGTGTGET